MYWHKYYSPGSYTPGRGWSTPSAAVTMPSARSRGIRGGQAAEARYYDERRLHSGDLDCEDIGEEVWVGDDDPDGLDGDGDGYGCEGW